MNLFAATLTIMILHFEGYDMVSEMQDEDECSVRLLAHHLVYQGTFDGYIMGRCSTVPTPENLIPAGDE